MINVAFDSVKMKAINKWYANSTVIFGWQELLTTSKQVVLIAFKCCFLDMPFYKFVVASYTLSLTIRPMLWSWHLRLYISTKIITPLIYYYIYGVGRHVFIGSSCIYDMHVGAGVFTVIKPFKKVV